MSLLAGSYGMSKLDALTRLVDDTVIAHERVQEILEAGGSEAAKDAYIAFSRGIVAFHAAETRYRLDELVL